MNKDLEALNRVRNKFIDFFHEDTPDFDILEQALTELKAIKEANPSGALKCLTGLEKEITQRDGYITNFLKIKFDIIKQVLVKAQEQEEENKVLKACIKGWEDNYEHLEFYFQNKEKALEIIKKKLVNVVDLYQCIDLYTYNSLVKGTLFNGVSRELTQEEFDSLKKEFCND